MPSCFLILLCVLIVSTECKRNLVYAPFDYMEKNGENDHPFETVLSFRNEHYIIGQRKGSCFGRSDADNHS